ncbi:FxLYD domain-containing protein [Kitasatospora indigofera]|uniref:FxLYD domain-containing protein n=1 Tax=Kitasatospora indigofera TaxID=67307 RepID=UPI003628B322
MERQQPRPTRQDTGAPTVRRPRVALAGAAAAVTAMALGTAALAGCSSDSTPSSAVSAVASAAQSALSAAASAAQSALASGASAAQSALASGASEFASAAASAEAAASSALASVKGGLEAKGDLTLGDVTTDSQGRAQVQLTVKNGQSQSYRYSVQVNFTDQSGNVLDATVVSVPEVAAGQSAQATAVSNRDLSGDVKAVVARAVRY